MAIYDKRENARTISRSATFKRDPQARPRKPESKPTMSRSKLGAGRGSGVDPRLSAPATYGPGPVGEGVGPPENTNVSPLSPINSGPRSLVGSTAQRRQGGIGGGGGTAGADQSGTGVGGSSNEKGFLSSLFESGGFLRRETGDKRSTLQRIGEYQGPLTPKPIETSRVQETTTTTPEPTSSISSVRQGDRLGNDIPGQIFDSATINGGQEEGVVDGIPVGDSGFYKKTNAAGATRYADAEGNFITNSDLTNRFGAGRGGVSNVGGPGGDKSDLDLDTDAGQQEGIRRNVAAYERQIQAIRGLREAQNPGITTGRTSLGNTGVETGGEYSDEGYFPSAAERNARMNRQQRDRDLYNLGPRMSSALASDRKTDATLRGQDIDANTRHRGQNLVSQAALGKLDVDRYGDELAAETSARERVRKSNEFAADYGLKEQRLILDDRAARVTEAYNSGKLGIDVAKLEQSGFKNVSDAINFAVKTSREQGPEQAYLQARVNIGASTADRLFPEEAAKLGQIEEGN